MTRTSMVTTVIGWTRYENVDITTGQCPSASMVGRRLSCLDRRRTDGSYP